MMRRFGAAAAMAAFGVFGSTAAAAVELVVLESSAPAYSAGQTMSTTVPIALVAGEVLIVVTDDARLLRIEGPHEGPAVGAAPEDSAVRKALDRLVSADEPRVGGVGAVRGDEDGHAVVADLRPEPWLLHAEKGGEQCVLRGRPIELWRETSTASGPMQITDASTDATAVVRWAQGAARAAWPTDAPPVTDDHIYLFRVGEATRSIAIRIRLLEPSVADSPLTAAAWLAAKGCLAQARLALR
jgi:hypothetical protein